MRRPQGADPDTWERERNARKGNANTNRNKAAMIVMIPFLARAGATVKVRKETRRSTLTLKCYDLVWFELGGETKPRAEDKKTPHDRNGRRRIFEEVVNSLSNLDAE